MLCRAVCVCVSHNAIAMLIQKKEQLSKKEKENKERPAARAHSRSAHFERAMSMAANVGRSLLDDSVGAGGSGGHGLPGDAAVVAETELGRSVADYLAVGAALA
jgi:hypothetical protein